MRFTDNQKKVLECLLNKYEKSKTYKGTNQRTQSFDIEPEKVWKSYTSDFADVEKVKDFELELEYLEQSGLVSLKKQYGVIQKIIACKEAIPEYYVLLQRKEKAVLLQEQFAFFSKWEEKQLPIIMPFCQEQLEWISVDKKPLYDIETAEKVFLILEYLQGNTKELLERELSVLMLSNSKEFEQKYRDKVCELLKKYGNHEQILFGVDEKREQQKILLGEYLVYENPSYIYLKGKAKLEFSDRNWLNIGLAPIAVSSELLKQLSSIVVETKTIMTVENLTSFHRMKEENCFYIFLSGYHNSTKQSFLKRIAEENKGKNWLHFGDIDPDGFYILEHLKRGTGIEFAPFRMDVETIKKFRRYCKKEPLTENDRTKAKNLLAAGKYTEILEYLLAEDCKLEQEIVSLYGG